MTSDTPTSELSALTAVDVFKERLSADLKVALKERRTEVVSLLRTTMAAIDNAGAVDAAGEDPSLLGGAIAGARLGTGSTEIRRRELTGEEIQLILQSEIDERTAAADRYAALERSDIADRLRWEADLLASYVIP